MNTINMLKEIAQIDILSASRSKTDFTLYEMVLTAPVAFREVLEGLGWVYSGNNEYMHTAPPVRIDFRRGNKLTNPSKRFFLKEVVRAIIESFDIKVTESVFQEFSEEIEGLPVSLMKNLIKENIVADVDINVTGEKEETFGAQENKMNIVDINTTEQKLMENKENITMKEFTVKVHPELKKAEVEGIFEKEGVIFAIKGRNITAYKEISEKEYEEWTWSIESYISSRMEEVYLEKCHKLSEEHDRRYRIEEAARIQKLKDDGLIDEYGNDIEPEETSGVQNMQENTGNIVETEDTVNSANEANIVDGIDNENNVSSKNNESKDNTEDDEDTLKLSELKGLPLFNNSKKPYIAWSEYENDEEKDFWPTKNGSISISKKTGEFFKTGENAWKGNNIVVVDIDSTFRDSSVQYAITDKFLELEGLTQKNTKEEKKKVTEKYISGVVTSASGGKHLYFTYPDGVELKNSQSKLIKGVDIRANGGIIVMPGTQAKSDKYEGTREYKLVFDEIKPLPEKLLEELLRVQKPSYVPPVTSGELISIDDSSLDAYRKAAVKNTVQRLEETTTNRNEKLTECARTLGMLLIDESVAYDLLAEASGKIGLPHSEFEATFYSAYIWGTQHPKQIEKKPFEPQKLSSLERKIKKIEKKENTLGVQGAQSMHENKVSIASPENIKIIEEVKKVEKEVRETNETNDSSGIVAISDEDKKQMQFEIESHARNLWEYEIDEVDVLRVSDTNKFVYYDEEDSVWKDTETPGHKLREYRRSKVNYFKEMGYKYQLDVSRTIKSMETESFIAAGKNVVVDSKGVKNEVFNGAKTEILVKNGVLNPSTGEVRKSTSKDMFTKKINTSYERTFDELIKDESYSEAAEKFEKVFKNFGSDEVRSYMQGILGNSLFAMPNRTSVSFWWYSKGSSGKSAIINALENTLGEFASRPAGDVFLASGDSFEFVTMEGSRVAFVEEAPSGWLHAGKLKKVVGTEKASMRNLHEKARKVTVTWTAHVSINSLPKVRPSDFDFGTLRRILILPFFTKYEKQEADLTLMTIADDSKVREIVLAWLVDGAKKWYADIDFEKNIPVEIIKATEDFYATVEADVDPMSDFISSVEPSEEHYINSDDLFEGWMDYARKNNINWKENSLRTIQKLEEKIGVKLTPKTRAKGMKASSYLLFHGELLDNANAQKKRLLGFRFNN